MRRWIVIGTIAIFAFAAARVVFVTTKNVDEDMTEYVRGLKYDFSAVIDSVIVENESKGIGWIVCRSLSGDVDLTVEDSLQARLKTHKRIRFLHPGDRGQFKIFKGGIRDYMVNDSVVINSNIDRFAVYRNGDIVVDTKVSQSTVMKVSFAFWLPD